jgi:hypothetical protein
MAETSAADRQSQRLRQPDRRFSPSVGLLQLVPVDDPVTAIGAVTGRTYPIADKRPQPVPLLERVKAGIGRARPAAMTG